MLWRPNSTAQTSRLGQKPGRRWRGAVGRPAGAEREHSAMHGESAMLMPIAPTPVSHGNP